MGPADQRAAEEFNSVLVYTSESLAEPMELIGDVTVTLYAATSARDSDWTARLCEVYPDGRSINLQEGIVRARYRDSLSEPSLLEPDRVYCYEIPLGPVGVRVAAGNRLRVTIASSDFPQWDRNLNTGGDLFQNTSMRFTIGASHRVAVHQRFVIGRRVHVARDVLGEHQSGGFTQRQAARRQRPSVVDNQS